MQILELPRVWPVACHTDHIGPYSTFVAIKGHKENGISYIPLALEKGARTIVVALDAHIPDSLKELIEQYKARLMYVEEPRRSLALLEAQGWGNPAEKLKIIGITGTKGKTTTAWLLAHLLQSAGYKTALLSTVQNRIDVHTFKTELTTQHPDYLHAFFYTCVQAGVSYVVMEVAAQAVSLHRVADLSFDGIIFTNFAPAHGEFYETVEDYFVAKSLLFAQAKPNVPIVINADDEKGCQLLEAYQDSTAFSIYKPFARVFADIKNGGRGGIIGTLNGVGNSLDFNCPALVGAFNAYNVLAAITMAWRLSIPMEKIVEALLTFTGVPGRLERYQLPNGASCFIDHAHNPLSFRALLPLLRGMTDHLIIVSGAGGDRDRSMRPELGKLMAEYGDIIILTADNPRSEDPVAIVQDMVLGIPVDTNAHVLCELDREVAIKKAYAFSKPHSIVALLGKGPEQYQIIGNQKHPFSERTIIQALG